MLLRTLFTTDELRNEYLTRTPAPRINLAGMGGPNLTQTKGREVEVLQARIATLKSIIGRLELIPTVAGIGGSATPPAESVALVLAKAFIVHGHDTGARHAVARVLGELDIQPIILFEQPSGGMTVIEKLERHSDVGFAVVLLTPDDEGREIGAPGSRARPRQNVVLELGYFIGKLTRLRVCALHKGDLELPSDYHGVVYVPMDDGGAWKYRLAGELKLAGYQIDKNKIS